MLQKFALAFKTKTIEFFAEEEEEEEEEAGSTSIDGAVLDASPEEVITGQRVVVLKPDPPPQRDLDAMISSLFAAVSSFRAAYLNLQTAHAPFDLDAIRIADRAAVSQLRRLSDLKRVWFPDHRSPNGNSNPSHSVPLSSHLEAEVQENQSLLRSLETIVNRMQSDIDRKDAESAELKQRLRDAEAINDHLERHLERLCSPAEEKVEALLTVGVFNSVLKDWCRMAHCFARTLIDLMKKSSWDLELVASSIYPDVRYTKRGHCRYAILSYVCLGMLEFFDSVSFGCEDSPILANPADVNIQKRNSIRHFIEHSTIDPFDLMNKEPNCHFAKFCHLKYKQVINSGLESSLLWNSEECKYFFGDLRPANSLYEPFVNMASSLWMLHKLAWTYDPVVEIFQVARGAEFSIVYMESVCRKSLVKNLGYRSVRGKVAFTVVPGFWVGKTVIQSLVFLDDKMQ
ncbi:hypothetical protein HPP92_021994 [Vanilla planifolia]|uniref:DUF641 domain-containing protein n=1 Tax=Vanilla planifolia TaxID=51239 RepID=A0A835PUW3_VANPL|nr:hypothetical protein HPP92_022307 [Vanilla planifolia]KAG0458866.1 hypothetical protein HPP92_021994 [Vanilla planifolia]